MEEKKIIVRDSFQAIGRGHVIECNYDERLHTGMKVMVRNHEYEITGVEKWMKTLDPPVPGDWMLLVLSPNIESMYIEIGDEMVILNH